MALLEDRTAVFIVRVWCERGDTDGSASPTSSEWRGSVEHVQSGQRVFFRNLEAVCEFMKPHLESLGIDAQRFWERISSAIDVEGEPVPNAVPAPARSKPSITMRKRR